ncbi:sulfite oxidase-like protein [Venturia nashicola]|nr:sulfite oxidase-like protein [Venturia nashicola]
MRTKIKEVNGIDWFDGAVMNCVWRGPRLRDVLSRAGIQDLLMTEKGYIGHAAFACYETPCQDDTWYGGSITLERAMLEDGDCILALEMNGEKLTPEHGAPIRSLCPGIAGARSVKWLNRITLQLQESPNFYQQRDYKILPPEATCVEEAKKYWHLCPSMMDMPINSIVGVPKSDSTVKVDDNHTIEVRGYAVPEGVHGPVVKVEVSADGGENWVTADLDYGGHGDLKTREGRRKIKWAWCLWHVRVNIEKGEGKRVVCRATDAGGNSQREDGVWNLRGVGYNAWGEVTGLTVI